VLTNVLKVLASVISMCSLHVILLSAITPRYLHYSLTVTVLFLCGALSDERTGLSFVYAAGPHQHILSRVRVSWDSRPCSTVSDLRLRFSSPPTTRRVMVEVFEPHHITKVYDWMDGRIII
jgi:hypothetical protein